MCVCVCVCTQYFLFLFAKKYEFLIRIYSTFSLAIFSRVEELRRMENFARFSTLMILFCSGEEKFLVLVFKGRAFAHSRAKKKEKN